uniref:Uncharacterized protein n=1 Tax=Romanomermis culicivorax TaxID=13658 RepID=A0A915L9P7_ROMCU
MDSISRIPLTERLRGSASLRPKPNSGSELSSKFPAISLDPDPIFLKSWTRTGSLRIKRGRSYIYFHLLINAQQLLSIKL